MSVFIYIQLILYCLLHFDISIATLIVDKVYCIHREFSSYCLPYAGSHNINMEDKRINKVIIVIHGILKDADKMCRETAEVVYKHENKSHTAIICPQFLTQSDIRKYALPDDTLFWSFEGWDNGDDAKNVELKINSISIIDALINQFSGKDVFPNLKKIIIIGFSSL